MQDIFEVWPRPEAHAYQVVAGQQPDGTNLVGRSLRQEAPHELEVLQVAVARGTVQPVQLHMLIETVKPNKALQGRALHLRHVLEPQMIGHQRRDLRGIVVREAQALADLLRHHGADFYMTIKTYAAVRSNRRRKRRRLAHIVQKHAPRKGW